jgi:hypothetical protein
MLDFGLRFFWKLCSQPLFCGMSSLQVLISSPQICAFDTHLKTSVPADRAGTGCASQQTGISVLLVAFVAFALQHREPMKSGEDVGICSNPNNEIVGGWYARCMGYIQ